MEIKDIGTKELKELNLYPIQGFNQLKACLQYGYCHIYVNRDCMGLIHSRRRKTIVPRYSSAKAIFTDVPDSEYWVLQQEIEFKDFNLIPIEHLSLIITGASSLSKILWLRKYLNGEVKGVYSKIEDSTFQEIVTSKEILKQDETIKTLKLQVLQLQEENRYLKNKIKQQENEMAKTIKLKTRLLKFISENKTFLENACEDLI